MNPFIEVQRHTRSLFVFEHGLGDFVNFMPVFKEFKKQTNTHIDLASSAKRQFYMLDASVKNVDEISYLKSRYDFIYQVAYPDSSNPALDIDYHIEPSKPYLCAYNELRMKPFVWEQWKIPNLNRDKNLNRVGVHLFGHTGMLLKYCPDASAVRIWTEISEAGFDPYECQIVPSWSNEYKDAQSYDLVRFPFLNEKSSLRFIENGSLRDLMLAIGSCDFFIGIDSGPLYLAASILGIDRVIGLTNRKKQSQFCPIHMQTVDVENYEFGKIKELLNKRRNL